MPGRHPALQEVATRIITIREVVDEIKDKATKEALKILEKEYEIFNGGPNLPSVKTLTRYDTWEEDKTIE